MNRAVDHISVYVEKLCRHEVSEFSGFDRSAAFGDETFVDLEFERDSRNRNSRAPTGIVQALISLAQSPLPML